MILDHTLPLLALLVDYGMNCQPFIRRHFLVCLFMAFCYNIVLLAYSLANDSPYPWIDWSSFRGTLEPILSVILTIVLFWLTEYITKRKLDYIGGHNNKTIVEILS